MQATERTWLKFGLYENNGETWFKSPAGNHLVGFFYGKRSDGENFWKSIALTPDSWERRDELVKEAEAVVATFLHCDCGDGGGRVCDEHKGMFAKAA